MEFKPKHKYNIDQNIENFMKQTSRRKEIVKLSNEASMRQSKFHNSRSLTPSKPQAERRYMRQGRDTLLSEPYKPLLDSTMTDKTEERHPSKVKEVRMDRSLVKSEFNANKHQTSKTLKTIRSSTPLAPGVKGRQLGEYVVEENRQFQKHDSLGQNKVTSKKIGSVTNYLANKGVELRSETQKKSDLELLNEKFEKECKNINRETYKQNSEFINMRSIAII